MHGRHLSALPELYGDTTLLRLVFVNLISNAVKFTNTRPRAEIKIGCKDQEDNFTCSIADNGVGFDIKFVNIIFGVFQRHIPKKNSKGQASGVQMCGALFPAMAGRPGLRGVWVRG